MKHDIDDLLTKKIRMFEDIDRQLTQNSFTNNNSNFNNKGINTILHNNKEYNNKAIFDKLYEFKEEKSIHNNYKNSINSNVHTSQLTRENSKKNMIVPNENKKLTLNPSSKRTTPFAMTPDSSTSKDIIFKGKNIDSIKFYQNGIFKGKQYDIRLDTKDLKRSRSRTPYLTDTTKEITSATIKKTDPYIKKDINSNRSNDKKKQMNDFIFQPKLNKNSLKIAEKLDPSASRLLKPKSRNRNSTPDSIENNKKISRSNTLRCLSQPNLLCQNLYNKAKIYQLKKEEKQKNKKIEEEKNFLALPFKPLLSNRTFNYKYNDNIQGNPHEKYYLMHENRKKLSEMKKERMREMLENEMLESCTFKPQINHEEIEDDEEFINQNLSQIIDYVFRRKRSLHKEKIKKNIEEKVFKTGKNFVVKPTIPKEFKLSTNKNSLTHRQSNNSDHLKMRELVNQDEFFKKTQLLEENYFSNETFYNKRISSGVYNKKI
jgi:hypothetical protein